MEMTPEQVIALIDLTTLNEDDTEVQVEALCRKAHTPYGTVAAVCILPRFITVAKKTLGEKSEVKVATVVNFPHGNDDIEAALSDTKEAIALGADQVDFVFPYKRNPVTDEAFCREFVRAIRRVTPKSVTLKAILETGVMTESDHIAAAGKICLEEGVHFLKTSTGKVKVGATPEAATTMIETVKAYGNTKRDEKEGRAFGGGFKASGGIRTYEDCLLYTDIAAKLMGEAFINRDHLLFGASGLLDNLLARIEAPSPSDD